LPLPCFFAIFAPGVAKVYIVTFRSNDDRRPPKFIVLADNMKSAINWLGNMEERTFNRVRQIHWASARKKSRRAASFVKTGVKQFSSE
jgi:hypothetical protein